MKEHGTTLLFVSHSIEQVQILCSKVVWLETGILQMQGDSMQFGNMYLKSKEH